MEARWSSPEWFKKAQRINHLILSFASCVLILVPTLHFILLWRVSPSFYSEAFHQKKELNENFANVLSSCLIYEIPWRLWELTLLCLLQSFFKRLHSHMVILNSNSLSFLGKVKNCLVEVSCYLMLVFSKYLQVCWVKKMDRLQQD